MFPDNPVWKIEKLCELHIPALMRIFGNERSIPEDLELSRRDRRNLESYFNGILDSVSCGERIYLVFSYRRKPDIIGGVSFIRDETVPGSWERSFWVSEKYRGQGHASRLTSIATAWLFSLGLGTVIREMTRPAHEASIRIKRHQGFQFATLHHGVGGSFREDILHRESFRPQHA